MIYHLSTHKAWETALEKGDYGIPPGDPFIHCSTAEQLDRTLEKHYANAQELVLLGIVEKRIRDLLKWEPNKEGALFPHIYGNIPLEAIETTDILFRKKDGSWEKA